MYALKVGEYPGGEVRASVVRVPSPRKPVPSLVSSSQNGTTHPEPVSPQSISTPLDSSESKEIRRSLRPPSFSLEGKRKLKRLVGAIEETCPKENIRFATATFPVWSAAAQAALASQTSYFNDRIQSWLYKKSPGIAWAYCWEFQKEGHSIATGC